MKIYKSDIHISFLALLVICICATLLCVRYTEWGIPAKYTAPFIILFSISTCIAYIAYLIYRDVFNPLTVYCLFIFFWGFSYLPITNRIIPLSNYASLLMSITVISFITGVISGQKVRTSPLSVKIKRHSRKIIMYGVMAISFLSFILECIKFGYVPVFHILSRDVYGETLGMLIPILHYFVMLANIIPIWAYIQYKEKIIDKKRFRIIILLSVFIIINYFSRQLLLLGLLSAGLTYIHYHYISLKKIILLSAIPVLLFLGVGALRLATIVNDQQSQKEFLSAYSGLQYNANLIEIYGALYASKNYTAFNDFVKRSDKSDYAGYGVYTFKPVLTITLLNKLGDFTQINPEFDTEDGIVTYATDPYLDFGITGIILFNLFYGFIVSYAYKRYKSKDIRAIGLWSALLFCLIMNCFINYLNTFFIWLIIIINIFLIPATNEYRRYNDR